jgi:hypothetical protein
MTPRLAIHDIPNHPAMHAETVSQLLMRDISTGVQVADGSDVRFGQLREGVRRSDIATDPRCSALDVPINAVVQVRPEKEMRGIATGRVIASMQYVHPVGDSTVYKSPCVAMSKSRTGFAVPVRIATCEPRPTGIRSGSAVNMRPKAIRTVLFPLLGPIGSAIKARLIHTSGVLAAVLVVLGEAVTRQLACAISANERRLWAHSGNLLHRFVGCRAPERYSAAGVFACLNYTPIRHEMAVR